MGERQIKIQPINANDFAPFGNLIALRQNPDKMINQNRCARHHDLAKLDFADGGKAGISLFNSEVFTLPYHFTMMERHPLGSQAFLPLYGHSFMVIVASDLNGQPHYPQAFMTKQGTGINIYKNIWHGTLTPLAEPGLFAVIDRLGDGDNLEEHWFDEGYMIVA